MLVAALIPEWVRRYPSGALRADLAAGLTTAVMLVPQSMAYAMLAGLPPVVGLYASTFPLLMYAWLGSSRQLAVGPVAMDSLLVAAAVGALTKDPTQYLILNGALTLLIGLFQVGLGALRLGFLVNFLSAPVVSGFTSAAAMIIGLSQLKHLFGVSMPSSPRIHELLPAALAALPKLEPTTTVIGLISIALIVVLKRHAPRLPSALATVTTATVAVWAFDLRAADVSTVGEVPAGLPAMSVPSLEGLPLEALVASAATIALVAFMESISVAKAIATRHGYPIHPNRELLGLGAANLASAVFGGFVVTGGFSRTAVNDQAGARTLLASVITASMVIATLLVLTPLFFHLPHATLAAIIMVAVWGLIDVQYARRLWTIDRVDFGLLALTFVVTLTVGIQVGIAAGVGASLLWFVIQSTTPHYAILGRLPGSVEFRNVARFPEAQPVPGALILRVDAQFHFANVTFLRDTLRTLLEQAGSDVSHVVIDATSINRLDSTAAAALHDIRRALAAQGISLRFAGLKGPVRDMFDRTGLREAIGDDHLHLNVDDAVRALDLVPSISPLRARSTAPAEPTPPQHTHVQHTADRP